MAEPRTAAGRALLTHLNSTDRGWYRSEILAIEAEAAGAALTAEVLAAALRTVLDYEDYGGDADVAARALIAALPATPPADSDGAAPCAMVGTFMDVPQLCGEPSDSPWHDRASEFFKHDYRARVAAQARDEALRLLRALVTDVQKEGSEWITSPSWSVLREARAYLAAHAEDTTE